MASNLNDLSLHLKGKIICKRSGNSGTVYIVDHGENIYPRYLAYKTIKGTFDPQKIQRFTRDIRKGVNTVIL